MPDRTYFHVTTRPHAPRRAWHALDEAGADLVYVGYCGFRFLGDGSRTFDLADRVPSPGHLCGSCGRVIAARTDIEAPAEDTSYGTVAPI